MKRSSGFTLIETLISALIISWVAVSLYSGFTEVTKAIRAVRIKQNAAALANEQFEIIRNLSYNDVGIAGGIPDGVLSRTKTITRDGIDFVVTLTIRNVDEEFDGTILEGDLSPADTKFVQVDISCEQCGDNIDYFKYVSRVAPKSLETTEGNGALFVQVFDADGQPLQGAEITIANNLEDPAILIEDTSNASGILQIVDAPPGTEAYEITVSRDGYSTDRTYATGDPSNPVPHAVHANVLEGLVTQVSFAIDELSEVTLQTTNDLCQPIGGVDVNFLSSKTIGLNTAKYDLDLTTNGSGIVLLDETEWDTYEATITDSAYHLAGSNPTLPLAVNPGSEQTLNLILKSKAGRGLLVQVLDASTNLPLSDATVEIDNGSVVSDITGQGFIRQTDWSGGGGQETYTNEDEFDNSSDIDYSTTPGELVLESFASVYESSGELESSIIDLGSLANLHEISWQPSDQPVAAGADSVKFQIATNDLLADPETLEPYPWNYRGPDGTGGSYYTVSGSTVDSGHDNSQYVRYKVFLETDDTSVSPNLSDVSFTFSNDCVPTGEVLFQGLAADDYDITVTRSGYTTQTIEDYAVSDDFHVVTVIMST